MMAYSARYNQVAKVYAVFDDKLGKFVDIDSVVKMLNQRDELLAALKVYADKDNWTEEAATYVLDGTVSASGDEGESRAVLLMDLPVVWNYSDYGFELAQAAIAKAEAK